MDRVGVIAVAVVLAIALIAVGVFAQVQGRIVGTVADASGSAVPSARVSLVVPGGATPILSVVTSPEGYFTLASVRPDTYDLTVEVPGFRKHLIRGVNVDASRDTVLPEIKLEVSEVTTEIAVLESVQGVQTSSVDVSSTITNAQIQRLPMIDRNPLALLTTQPGVIDGRGPAVINGQRTSFTNVTLDGINIQDNLFRSNALNFVPNLLTVDQLSEVTVSTSNASSTVTGGGSQVSFVTPSGTNAFHGSLYWYNRNSALAANDWFNNRDGIKNPFLNQNQAGGSVGGPIKRDKLFFYTNYEAFRLRQQSPEQRTILTSDARQGIFTYRDSSGVVRNVNILQAANVGIDPGMQQLLNQVPGPENINNFRTGDSSASLVRNTGGYSFLRRDNRTRDNVTGKIDFHPSTRHAFSASFGIATLLIETTRQRRPTGKATGLYRMSSTTTRRICCRSGGDGTRLLISQTSFAADSISPQPDS
jgi:hypothetical protein